MWQLWWSRGFSCNFLCKLGLQGSTSAISWNVIRPRVFEPHKNPFASSWTPTGMRWTCSNSSRTIQSPMRWRAPTVSHSTVQSLLRGRRKVPVIKFSSRRKTSQFNQISTSYLWPLKKNNNNTDFNFISTWSSCLQLNLSVFSVPKPSMKFAVLLRLCKVLSPPKQETVAQLSRASNLLRCVLKAIEIILPYLYWEAVHLSGEPERRRKGFCAWTLTPWAKTPHLFPLWAPPCIPQQRKTSAENRW